MTSAVQQSLLEPVGGEPIIQSVRWIESVLLGEIALAICVLAVAFFGALILTARLPLRESMRIVVGCFVLLGAPLIAAGFMSDGSAAVAEPTSLIPISVATSRPDLPPADFDPYAGASLRAD